MYEGQRTTWRGRSSPTVWVLGVALKSSSLPTQPSRRAPLTFLIVFKIHLFYFLSMNALPEYIYVHHMHRVSKEARKGASDLMGVELQIVVSHRGVLGTKP